MHATVTIVALVGILVMHTAVYAEDSEKTQQEKSTLSLLQLRLIGEITNFENTWEATDSKCQVLAQYTHHTVDRFFDQPERPDKYTARDNAAKKKADELAKELGCERDNDNMWHRFYNLGRVFNTNNAEIARLIKREQEAQKQLEQERAKGTVTAQGNATA
jgi:hypothetical protein